MNNWKQTSIGEFIDFNPSESIKKDDIARKIPMDKLGTFQRKINGSEYSKYGAGPKFRNKDILVAKITPCLENGKTAYVDILDENEVAFGSSEFIVLRQNQNSDSKFIYYLARGPLFRDKAISCMEGTSGRKRVNEGALKRQEILVPKLKSDQQKIASVLSALDDKIELNNKINIELEQMAKTLYEYWFVQFDFPYVTSSGVEKPYKSSGGKMVWNEELKREIPEGWEVKTLLDIATFTNGLACQKFRPNEGEDYYRVIKIREMGSGFTDNSEFVSTNIPPRVVINNGDVLFSWSATLDVKIWTGGKGALNQHIFKVTSKSHARSFYYYELLNYLQHFKMQAELRKTTMGHITQDHLKQSRITIPPQHIIEKLDKIINPILNKKVKLDEENQELASLRDWLLPMLMNGQVRVGDVEKELGMVAESLANYQLSLTDKDKKIRRKMLATYIINQSLKDTSFGKTKFEKLLHLIECHIVKGDYNQRYSVQAAGPYDGGFTKVFWNEVTNAKWFKIEEFGKLKRIMPAENHSKSLADYGYFSDDLKVMINDFIGEFKNTNYERPEIVSTLYAVWNNRIICNEIITDELLKKDFLDWDTQKIRYKDRLDKALEWMRENGIVPDGWGNEIRRAKK